MVNHPLQILVPGTVLWDIYADTGEAHLGGAEFNFAYHVHQLTGGVDFLARVGADEPGRHLLAELERRGFPTRFIQVDPNKPSKTVTVTEDARGEPRFVIPDGTAAEHLEPPPLSAWDLAGYDLIYFGTTLQSGERSRTTLRDLLVACSGLKFCDLNLRPPKYTREVVEYSLRTCEVLKLNAEELQEVAGLFGLSGEREALMRAVAKTFDVPRVCVTLGAQGSLLLAHGRTWKKTIPKLAAVDTVGAGDAFSACLAIGLLHGWEPPAILDFASDFAAAICGIQGAVPRDPDFYRPFLARVAE